MSSRKKTSVYKKPLIFQSLNCSLCAIPFTASPSEDPQSPRKLLCENGAICKKCHAEESILHWKQRKHQCDKKGECLQDRPAYFISDLLTSPSIELSLNKKGYVLSEPFTPKECPICHEEYSLKSPKREPYDLLCNHTICNGCFAGYSSQTTAISLFDFFDDEIMNIDNNPRFEVKCPLCGIADYYQKKTRANNLKVFLRELPLMTAQASMKKNDFPDKLNCMACSQKYDINDIFFCTTCNTKICGICAFRTHRDHDVSEVSWDELKRIVKCTKDQLDLQLSTYHTLFPNLHLDLDTKMIDIRKGFQKRTEAMLSTSFHKAKIEHQACTALGDEFETISEEYMPHLRAFDTKLKELLSRISSKSK